MADNHYPCEDVVPIEEEPRHHLVMANDVVRAFAVEIAPHDHTLCHHHEHEYLMYVAGEARIVSAPREGEPAIHTYPDGDCELSPPGLVHIVENLRDVPFRNLLIELMPEASRLRPGSEPKASSGTVKIDRRFCKEPVSVFYLEMERDAQAEIQGPVIVASPYGSAVELAARQENRVLKRFNDLVWIDASVRAIVRNNARAEASVVLIAVGQE